MKKRYKKITLAGLMYAIIIVMQLIKNVSPFISGPIINTVMVIVVIRLGLLWGVGFSVLVPITSMLFAPASAMTIVTGLTNGCTLPVIIIGNMLFILSAYLSKNSGFKIFFVGLLIGAVVKWLFMWACVDIIIKPLFEQKLGDMVAVVNKIFSTLQLYSGLLSIVLILPITRALDKIKD